MDCKTIMDIVLTAAIAVFAGLTWRATQKYARMTALTLLLPIYKEIVSSGNSANRSTTIQVMKMIKKEFPDMYKNVREFMNPSTQAEIEK
jgi:hypothetical protein